MTEERARMDAVEKQVLTVLTSDEPKTADEVFEEAVARLKVDKGEVAAAIWRLAGVNRVRITDDLRVRRVS